MEDFSSDHAVILQRVYNFLSSVLGSDPQRLHSLVTDGHIPVVDRLEATSRRSQTDADSFHLRVCSRRSASSI
jgi:hypothetical protein